MAGHESSRSLYFTIYIVLLLLLGLTVGIAKLDLREWGLGDFALAAALLVAGAKTILILLYFMHLRSASALNRLIACVGVLGFSLLLGVTLLDASHRTEQARLAVMPSRLAPR